MKTNPTILILLTILYCFMYSCKQEDCPYEEQVLYHETFDTFGNWETQPNQFGFTADSCIKVEDGKLKMKYEDGISGCGGTWVGLSIKDSSSYQSTFLDKIGVRFSVDSGSFYEVIRWHDTIGVNGQPTQHGDVPIRSLMRFQFNSISASFPSTESSSVDRDSVFDIYMNRIQGHEYEVVYDRGEFSLYIDGLNHSTENVAFGDHWANPVYLSIDLNLGHLPELNPRTEVLHVSDFEIYTWCGQKHY